MWSKLYLPILIASALLVAAQVTAASQQSRPEKHKADSAKQSEGVKQQEPQVPLSVWQRTEAALNESIRAQKEQSIAAQKQAEAYQETWHSPSVIVQLLLAGVGAGYLVFACLQWLAIKEQARLTKESLIADKRAFICADLLTPWWEPDATTTLHNWRFRPRLRNTGGTPTKDLRSHVECDIRNQRLPLGHVFVDQNTDVGTGMIPPNGESAGGLAPQGSAITPQDIVEAQAFRRFIYLWGWIKYHDVFPDTPEHTTHFCWLIIVVGDPMTFVPNTPGQPPTPGTLNFNFLQHPEGNYAD